MVRRKHLQSALIGLGALLFTAAQVAPGRQQSGPVLTKTLSWLNEGRTDGRDSVASKRSSPSLAIATRRAIDVLTRVIGPLSSPEALPDAIRSYFAFKSAHPDAVRNPYFYFVDYGLPSSEPRGYVLDMAALRIVDGPFTVAHGRGSSRSRYGVPTLFSNALGSEATSLGLYLTGATYAFRGRVAGRAYRSIGLRLLGVSDGFNDNAFARRVVAHGAPYVTATKSGRSEGCPAMEQSRARRLLPKLANGGMVFLYAPDSSWLEGDPWLNSDSE
jgi:hypothetical protein